MHLAAEHFYYHLAQALDRLAACVIGVAALKTDIVKADWADVIRAIEVARGEPLKKHALDDEGTDGRAAQDRILLAIDSARSVGPAGWLAWVLDMRNTHAHRASPMRWNMITNDKSGPSGIETPFYKQPGWPEVEAMLRERGSTGSAADLLIMEDPLGLMGDLLALMSDLLATTTTALAELWSLRRSDPTLLVQPGKQWKSVFDRTLSEFEGTGARQIQMQTKGSTVRVGTELSLRLQASKVLDADSGFWD